MFPTLNHFGVGIIPWSPRARGLLTRPFNGETMTEQGNDLWVCCHLPNREQPSFILATLTT
jgi:aryl-alcohol dehydrogenase-like predicted oxidoreductase